MCHEDEHKTFPSVHCYAAGGFFDPVWGADQVGGGICGGSATKGYQCMDF